MPLDSLTPSEILELWLQQEDLSEQAAADLVKAKQAELNSVDPWTEPKLQALQTPANRAWIRAVRQGGYPRRLKKRANARTDQRYHALAHLLSEQTRRVEVQEFLDQVVARQGVGPGQLTAHDAAVDARAQPFSQRLLDAYELRLQAQNMDPKAIRALIQVLNEVVPEVARIGAEERRWSRLRHREHMLEAAPPARARVADSTPSMVRKMMQTRPGNITRGELQRHLIILSNLVKTPEALVWAQEDRKLQRGVAATLKAAETLCGRLDPKDPSTQLVDELRAFIKSC